MAEDSAQFFYRHLTQHWLPSMTTTDLTHSPGTLAPNASSLSSPASSSPARRASSEPRDLRHLVDDMSIHVFPPLNSRSCMEHNLQSPVSPSPAPSPIFLEEGRPIGRGRRGGHMGRRSLQTSVEEEDLATNMNAGTRARGGRGGRRRGRTSSNVVYPLER